MQSFVESATHKVAAGISEKKNACRCYLSPASSDLVLPCLDWGMLWLLAVHSSSSLCAGGVCGQSKVLFLGHRQRVCLFLLITVLAVSLYSWEEVGSWRCEFQQDVYGQPMKCLLWGSQSVYFTGH